MKPVLSTYNSSRSSGLQGWGVAGVGRQNGSQSGRSVHQGAGAVAISGVPSATALMPMTRIAGAAGLNYFGVPPWGDVS